MNGSDLSGAHHLNRLAVVDIRQSSPRQVLTNQERLRLQYALRPQAQALGWRPEDLGVSDADPGLTAAAAQHRAGFRDLLARVPLGQVGIPLRSA